MSTNKDSKTGRYLSEGGADETTDDQLDDTTAEEHGGRRGSDIGRALDRMSDTVSELRTEIAAAPHQALERLVAAATVVATRQEFTDHLEAACAVLPTLVGHSPLKETEAVEDEWRKAADRVADDTSTNWGPRAPSVVRRAFTLLELLKSPAGSEEATSYGPRTGPSDRPAGTRRLVDVEALENDAEPAQADQRSTATAGRSRTRSGTATARRGSSEGGDGR